MDLVLCIVLDFINLDSRHLIVARQTRRWSYVA